MKTALAAAAMLFAASTFGAARGWAVGVIDPAWQRTPGAVEKLTLDVDGRRLDMPPD